MNLFLALSKKSKDLRVGKPSWFFFESAPEILCFSSFGWLSCTSHLTMAMAQKELSTSHWQKEKSTITTVPIGFSAKPIWPPGAMGQNPSST